jgi:xylan 1,4-beta-xylosidase
MARSRDIRGPYETHPAKHLITARFSPGHPIQRMGHGQYVEGHDGRHWHTYLCGRPQAGPRGSFCATGRETGLAEVVWRDDWLWLKDGGQVPPTAINLPAVRVGSAAVIRDFHGPDLPPEFQWLRTPQPERLFTLTGTALRLIGRESLGSWFEQSLVARRQEEPAYAAEADFIADPRSWQQAAGLITYYNRHKFHAALITREGRQRGVSLVSCLGDWPGEALTFHARVPVAEGAVRIGVAVDGPVQRFSLNGVEVGPVLDASIVSDEGGRGEHASFTGAFVGMVAYDLTGQGWTADVTRFRYESRI